MMKRRKFVQSLMATSALSAAVEAGQAPPPATTKQPDAQPNTAARQQSWQRPAVPKLQVTAADVTAEPAPRFFNSIQFATLQKLGAVLVPPLKNHPSALEAKAPEFLDFLIGVSPQDRQNIYRSGLDQLESQSKEKHQKPFAELTTTQVDAILRPLLVARPWPADLPSDPLQSFVAQVHEDLQTATTNSREWAAASEKAGRRFSRGFQGSGYYWAPIDPISQG